MDYKEKPELQAESDHSQKLREAERSSPEVCDSARHQFRLDELVGARNERSNSVAESNSNRRNETVERLLGDVGKGENRRELVQLESGETHSSLHELDCDPDVAGRYRELESEGHGPQRHGPFVTDEMLNDRAYLRLDPMTGTTEDFYEFDHNCARHATRFDSAEALVHAEEVIRESSGYHHERSKAEANEDVKFKVVQDIEEVFSGEHLPVSGISKTKEGLISMDFSAGTVLAIYERESCSTADWKLLTIYPNEKEDS